MNTSRAKTPVGKLPSQIKVGTSYTPTLTLTQATEKFIASRNTLSDIGDGHLRDFLEVMGRLTFLNRTFDFNQMIRECSNKEIPFPVAAELFGAWLAHMQKLNKIENLGSPIYDCDTYLVLN